MRIYSQNDHVEGESVPIMITSVDKEKVNMIAQSCKGGPLQFEIPNGEAHIQGRV